MSDSNRKAMADLALLQSQTDFAFDLLRENASNNSLIISPISIALALSLAYVGGSGKTRQEFNSVFAKDKTNEELDSFFERTLAEIGSPKNVTLEVANRAYAEQTLKILDSYKKTINDKYGGDFETLDFIKASSDAVKKINSYVSDKTHNKINNLLSDDVVNSDTRLILVNAIYFKGDWLNKFDEKRTVDQTFYVSENSEKKVKMMKMKQKVKYTENDEVQVLELPYVDKSVSFVAFLPKEKFGLNKFIESLNASKLFELRESLSEQEVNIELPRFKVESEFALKSVLTKLGLGEGFSSSADFSKITAEDRLFISEVVHKGFVEVNEEGSEAAASTAVVMQLMSLTIEPDFIANRPFMWAIMNGRVPLFIGQFLGSST